MQKNVLRINTHLNILASFTIREGFFNMKKITIAAISTLALMTVFTNSFATMHVDGRSANLISDPNLPFEGKIYLVSYFYQNHDEPTIAVDVVDENNSLVQIAFKGADFNAGAAFLNAVGKPLVVEFADTNFNVKGVFTYDNSSHNKPTLANLHTKFKANK